MGEEQLRKRRRAVNRHMPADVVEALKQGNTFVPVKREIDDLPEGYMIVNPSLTVK